MTLTHEPSQARLGFQLAYGDTDTVGIAYFALIGRHKLILSPEEEFALEHVKKG